VQGLAKLAASALLIPVLLLTGCAPAPLAAPSRGELARSAAVSVVAAASRGDATELESRFGKPLTPENISTLQATVPATMGADPIMYDATFPGAPDLDRVATATARVTQSHSRPVPPVVLLVMIEWDASAPQGVWRVVAIRRE
jgi:hypothetical protein